MSGLHRHAARLVRAGRVALTVLAIVWLARFVHDNAAALAEAAAQVDRRALGLAAAAAVAGLLPGAWAWQRLMALALPDLGPGRGVLVYLRSGIGKYTPGGALAFAIQHRALNDPRAGLSRLFRVFAATALAACIAAAFLGVPAMAHALGAPVGLVSGALMFPAAALLFLAARRPGWPVGATTLDRLGVPAPQMFVQTVVIMGGAWALTGLHLVAIGMTFGAAPVFLLSAFALSAIVGIVFAVLPGALGVREGALALILASRIDPVDAMAIALLSRALIAAADVLGTVIAAMLLAWGGSFHRSTGKAAIQ